MLTRETVYVVYAGQLDGDSIYNSFIAIWNTIKVKTVEGVKTQSFQGKTIVLVEFGFFLTDAQLQIEGIREFLQNMYLVIRELILQGAVIVVGAGNDAVRRIYSPIQDAKFSDI